MTARLPNLLLLLLLHLLFFNLRNFFVDCPVYLFATTMIIINNDGDYELMMIMIMNL